MSSPKKKEKKKQKKQKIARSFSRSANSYDTAANMQHRIGQTLTQMMPSISEKAPMILDLGCGTGRHIKQLHSPYKHSKVIGVDIAFDMLKQSLKKNNSRTHFIAADFDTLPFLDNTFDLVFANMSLQWSLNLKTTLREIKRILKPKGSLAFSIPCDGTLNEIPNKNKFLTTFHVKRLLNQSSFLESNYDYQSMIDYFDTPLLAIQSLKKTGSSQVINSEKSALKTKVDKKTLLEKVNQHRTLDHKIPLTYCIYFSISQLESK